MRPLNRETEPWQMCRTVQSREQHEFTRFLRWAQKAARRLEHLSGKWDGEGCKRRF
jgi:hypothetical protein